VICGLPLYEYDHLVPWSEVETHEAHNLVLLCDRHHREKTSGLLPLARVIEANKAPANLSTGVSSPFDLHYGGHDCEALIGSNVHTWPRMHDGLMTVPVLIDDTPIVMFRVEDGHLLLAVQLFDEDNELLVQVFDNELVFSTEEWDVEFEGRKLTVRSAPRNVFVGMTFEPPSRVVIDRGRIWRNGIKVTIQQAYVLVGNGNKISGSRMVNCNFGLATGDLPEGVGGGAIYVGSSRSDFPMASTEDRVMRIGVANDRGPSEEGNDQLMKDFMDFLDHVDPDDFFAGGSD
jgi:trigger factor